MLIEELFQAFAAKHNARFPSEPPLTKRQASKWLSETDFHVLARWTNEASHAKRRDWRIPIARVYDLCQALDATSDQLDELMVARLNELLAHDKSEDIPALLHWLGPMLEEFSNRPAVGPLERQVLAAFGRAYDATEVAHHCPAPFELDDELEAGLKDWLGRAVGAHADQLGAEAELDGEDTPAEKAARETKLASIKARLIARQAAAAPPPAPPPTRRGYDRQRKALIKEFSRSLRKQWREQPARTEVAPWVAAPVESSPDAGAVD